MCLAAYVATPTKGSELAGVVTFRPSKTTYIELLGVNKRPKTTYIESLGVNKRHQKKGIGTQLLLAVEQQTSCNSLKLYSYTESIGFYTKIGFTCTINDCVRACNPKDHVAFKSKI